MCGDDFSPQLILNPMMDQCESPRHQADNAGMGRTVVIETFVPSAGRKVRFSVTTAAYHTALVWVADGNYYHGYILAYSTRRKASLYHLE